MKKIEKIGHFEVIDSFAIKSRNEFYFIGEIIEGIIKRNWFLNIPFNNTVRLSIRISAIEEIEFSTELKKYKLIIINANKDLIDILLGLEINL